MGNRAVLDMDGKVGIYLHWNGGRDSVEAFLRAAQDLGIRHDDYGTARLCQIIGNWMGGTLSVGCGDLRTLDVNNGDNGLYKIRGWKIVGRQGIGQGEQIDAKKTETIYQQCMKINRPILAGEPLVSVEQSLASAFSPNEPTGNDYY